jgi:hypothetical protein
VEGLAAHGHGPGLVDHSPVQRDNEVVDLLEVDHAKAVRGDLLGKVKADLERQIHRLTALGVGQLYGRIGCVGSSLERWCRELRQLGGRERNELERATVGRREQQRVCDKPVEAVNKHQRCGKAGKL